MMMISLLLELRVFVETRTVGRGGAADKGHGGGDDLAVGHELGETHGLFLFHEEAFVLHLLADVEAGADEATGNVGADLHVQKKAQGSRSRARCRARRNSCA